jgi:hypothetical protein
MGIEPRTVAERCRNLSGQDIVPDFLGKTRWVAKIDVIIVTLKEHQFVIAGQPDHLSARFGRLALKRPEERDTLARIWPPVDYVTDLN